MPYKSMAQLRKFHADPKLRKYVKEFDAATPNIGALPERIGPVVSKNKRKKRRHHNQRLAQMLAQTPPVVSHRR